MNRIVFVGAAFGAAGFALGVIALRHALMEPLDVLAFPYRNQPHVTTEPLRVRVESTGETFVLPAGTPLIYRHDAEGQPHLAILVASEPGELVPLREVDARESVYIISSGEQ